MKTMEYSISEADAVRHLIVCDTQFTWAGVTNLTMPQMMDLQARGWVAEGDSNDEFQLTEAGEAVVARALEHGAPATLATVKHGGCVQLGEPRSHRWDDVGERCLDCGDKDWMGGACSGPRATAVAGPWLSITNAPNDGQQHIRGLWVTSRIDGEPDTREWRQYIGLVNDGGEFVDPEYGETFGWEADEYEAWMPAAEAPGAALSAQPQYITDAYELGMRDGQNLSAQPSPGGQGDGLVESLVQIMNAQYDGLGYLPADVLGVLNMAVEALAARQPVCATVKDSLTVGAGQPVDNGWSGWATQYPGALPKLYGARAIAEVNYCPEEGQRLIFLSEQPAQAVDLGQFLPAVRMLVVSARTSGGTAGRDAHLCEALDRVEALLPKADSQAVQS